MGKKFAVLSLLFGLLLLSGMTAIMLDFEKIILVSVFAASIIVFLLLVGFWLSYTRKLADESSDALDEERTTVWSFRNMDLARQKNELLRNKLKSSAALLSNLTHPDKIRDITSIDVKDPIGKALHSLKVEMEKIKEEDEQRAWVNQGVAKFGEILRNKQELKQYAYQIISNLVKHLSANQGGIYIEDCDSEGNRFLNLVACYAYGKEKQAETKIFEGQGMLGQCMLEKELMLLTDVPKDYVKITSGLGEALPRNIVVVPLIFNDKFYGAVELASFEILRKHHIDFLKKVSEDIASEISTLKNMEHTRELLSESNQLTEELQVREVEMRKSMMELAAAQEAMAVKQSELSGVINAIDNTLATAELTMEGLIAETNLLFNRLFGWETPPSRNFDYTLIIGRVTEISWSDVVNGRVNSGDFITADSQARTLWLSVTFNVIADADGAASSVLCMIQDITQKKIREQEFERLSLVANNTDNSVIITDHNGITEYVNEGFIKMTGYNAASIIGKKPGNLLQGPLTDSDTILKLSRDLRAGVPIYEEILNYNSKGETYWVSLAINPVKDQAGNIYRFISIQTNITETKSKALDVQQKMAALSRSNAIIEIDTNGTIIEINDNYRELMGYERSELIGKPYAMLTQKENIFSKMLTTIATDGVQSGVYYRYDKNGNRHHMKLMDYPVLNMKGELEKIIEFGVDVSNEKRLEKEAERRQAELKSYLNGIDNTIASAEFSVDGVFTNGNEIFLKVTGFSKEDLHGKGVVFFMGADPLVVMMWDNLRLGKFFSGEFKLKHKTGKELWLTGTFNPIIVEGDKVEKIMMFAQFTTTEKEKLNDLNGMVNALKATFPVIEFNGDFACKTANEKALKVFGLSRLQLRNKTALDFIAPFYHETWKAICGSFLDHEITTFQLPIQADSRTVMYEVSISIIKNLEGKVSKIILILVKSVEERIPVLAAM